MAESPYIDVLAHARIVDLLDAVNKLAQTVTEIIRPLAPSTDTDAATNRLVAAQEAIGKIISEYTREMAELKGTENADE